MTNFDRDELARKYPALDRDIHGSDPIVDQIEASHRGACTVYAAGKRNHDRPVPLGVRRFSPAARLHPRLSAAIDAAREIRSTVADSRWYEQVADLDYIHSNLPNRRPLRYEDDGHDLNVVDLQHAAEVESYRLALEASTTGFGARCVMLVSESAPTYAPSLPWRWTDGGEVAASVVAFPVPQGVSADRVAYSTERVARLALHTFPAPCHWCGGHLPQLGLLVSADPTVYLFPTCLSCGHGLERECDFAGLDFVANDGWVFGTGWPADEYL